MAWIYVLIAGIFEVVWAMGMKYSEGFTRIYPSLITVVGIACITNMATGIQKNYHFQ